MERNCGIGYNKRPWWLEIRGALHSCSKCSEKIRCSSHDPLKKLHGLKNQNAEAGVFFRMYNALFISNSPNIGGAERSLETYLKYRDEGSKISILVPAGGQIEETKIFESYPNVTTIYVTGMAPLSKKAPHRYLRGLPRIYDAIRGKNFDFVYCNSATGTHWGYPLSIILKKPLLIHLRDKSFCGTTKLFVRLSKQKAFFIANSKYTKQQVEEILGTLPNICIMPNAVDTEKFNTEVPIQYLEDEFGKACGKSKKVGIVGRVTQWKGHKQFLEIAKFLQNEPIKWFVVGDDKASSDKGFLNKIQAQTEKLGLSNNVVFLGFRKDVPNILRYLDIVIMPSHFESFGRTAIEAMACGTPVIAWNIGGLKEIITHSYDGYLCDAFDIKSTAKYIMELVNNSKLRNEISKTAITTATSKYGAKKYTMDLEILFKKVTKNRGFNQFD